MKLLHMVTKPLNNGDVMTDSKVQTDTVLHVVKPNNENSGKLQTVQWARSVLEDGGGGGGGACMHKTDGKLFCVAAPIPGAGAGEREWGLRSMRWEATWGKPNAQWKSEDRGTKK